MALTELQRNTAVRIFQGAPDDYVRAPLWDFHPYYRPLILTERARRGFNHIDPEPTGDPEYS